MRSLIVSIIFVALAQAQTLEGYFQKADTYISSALDRLDIWLSRSHKNEHVSFYIRASVTAAFEERYKPLYRFNIKSHFTLPRTTKKLKLFLEDFRQKEAVDNQNAKNIADVTQNDAYLFGLAYAVHRKLHYRAGMKFNSFDPFAGVGYDDLWRIHDIRIAYGINYLYYIKRHSDLRVVCNCSYPLSPSATLAWENSYRYQEKSDYRNQLHTSIKLYRTLPQSTLTYHGDIYANDTSSQGMEINYYYTGVDWTRYFLHRHLFFTLSPGIMWRNEKGYQKDFRCMLTLGVQLWKK